MADNLTSVGKLIGGQLQPSEWSALQRAGSVAEERRGNSVRFRLRYRVDGRQRVINLGADRKRAALVAQALEVLQASRRAERQLRAACQAALRERREAKRQLESAVRMLGFTWHGRMIRRPRSSS